MMTARFEMPTFEALVTEQAVVQGEKTRNRALGDYSNVIFPTQTWTKPRSCAVTDFMRPYCVDERVSLDGVAKGLCRARGSDKPLHWVDMGGGRGLALRQLALKVGSPENLITTNVDLFNMGVVGLSRQKRAQLEEETPGVTSETVAPRFIRADIQTVELPEPANVITAVETMQYLNDPLAAISNWYNQLAAGGSLIISAEHVWSESIRYVFGPGSDHTQTPTRHLLETFDAARIPYAATLDVDYASGHRPDLDPSKFYTLALQKVTGTRLVVNSGIAEIWENKDSYKGVYYEPRPDYQPIVEIVPAC